MAVSVTMKFNKLPQMPGQLRAAAGRAVRATAFEVERDWKAAAPVDTGLYRNSVHTDTPTDTSAVVSSPVEYGPFLEFGTHAMAARPHVTPAAERGQQSLVRRIKAIGSELL